MKASASPATIRASKVTNLEQNTPMKCQWPGCTELPAPGKKFCRIHLEIAQLSEANRGKRIVVPSRKPRRRNT
jgi:hypothetical protein